MPYPQKEAINLQKMHEWNNAAYMETKVLTQFAHPAQGFINSMDESTISSK